MSAGITAGSPKTPGIVARVLIALAASATVFLCAARLWGPEHSWVLAPLQYLPYPVLLAPALAAVVLSLRCAARWRALAGASLALTLTALMGLELNWPGAQGGHVRVMTYNVKSYLGIARPGWALLLAQEIATHDPDVLVLQDANDLRRLAPATMNAMMGGRAIYAFGQYVIASRFPLRDCGEGEIPIRDAPHTFVRCEVEAPGSRIDVVTAHFLTPRDGLDDLRRGSLAAGSRAWKQNVADRMEQAHHLAAGIAVRGRPTIVAGDFNAPPGSLVLRALEATGMRDAFDVAGLGYGYTYGHSLRPGISFLRLDHILVSEELHVAGCFVGGKAASPHRPVIADISLRRHS